MARKTKKYEPYVFYGGCYGSDLNPGAVRLRAQAAPDAGFSGVGFRIARTQSALLRLTTALAFFIQVSP